MVGIPLMVAIVIIFVFVKNVDHFQKKLEVLYKEDMF